MKIGFVGLGKMGFNMVEALLEKNHKIVATDVNEKTVKDIGKKGALGVFSIKDMISCLPKQKVVWVMVPHGKPTDMVIDEVASYLKKGDIIIDGGNTFWKETVARGKKLTKKGIQLIDVGTSGGLEGARHGASMMVGGEKKAFKKVEPVIKSLSIKDGYGYMGKSGAGHFVKMVHNGIEYSLLQSYAEGYEIVHTSQFKPDLREVTKTWQHGSVIRSWLVDLMADYLKKNPSFKGNTGVIGGGSTGTWTQKSAKELGVSTPMLDVAIKERKKSQKKQTFAHKVVAALRLGFGGHKIPKK